jgi:3D (Asp-Asp-Asp) domain-containing protein
MPTLTKQLVTPSTAATFRAAPVPAAVVPPRAGRGAAWRVGRVLVGLALAAGSLVFARPADAAGPPAAKARTVRMMVTAYCACTKCCGPNAQGITASGKPVSYNQGRFVAADRDVLRLGQKLSIPGYHDGRAVEVLDTGSAIKGNRLDVYFPSHRRALEWGRQWLDVTVVGGD